MERILLAAVIASLIAVFYFSYGEHEPVERHRIPAMLQICGSELFKYEEQITAKPFWDDLVVEVRDKYPGFCLSGVNYSETSNGYYVYYIVKSPDRKTLASGVYEYRHTFLTSN